MGVVSLECHEAGGCVLLRESRKDWVVLLRRCTKEQAGMIM